MMSSSLVATLPRELKEETVKYCYHFTCVLTELFPVTKESEHISSILLAENSAQRGHLSLLKWAREKGYPWNEFTPRAAALGGHLEILKWFRENKCPWDSEWICYYAAKAGHLHILQWCWNNDCYYFDSWTCRKASQGGHFEILKWLHTKG